jgi:hypothetical protein
MTSTIVYSSTGDGYLRSDHATYSGMYNGTVVTVIAGGNVGYYGRNPNAGQYQGFQPGIAFTYSAVAATELVIAAYVRLYTGVVVNPSINRSLDLRPFAFGTLSTTDWRTPIGFSSLPDHIHYTNVNGSNGKYIHGGSDLFAALVKASTLIELLGIGTLQYSSTPPTQDEGSAFYVSETAGTEADPALIFSTVSRSRLTHVLGACVKLTDGTWAYLESDAAVLPTITLKHCTTTGVVTTVATIPIGTEADEFFVIGTNSAVAGAQALALCIDGSNNLYVIGKSGSAVNNLAAKGYVKGGGYTWAAQTLRTWPLIAYDAQINACAAVYQTVSGGVLMCAFAHAPGDAIGGTTGNELAYAVLDAAFLRTGVGSLMKHHGSAIAAGLQPGAIASDVWNAYANEVGAGLDVATPTGGNTDWGFVASFTKEQGIGENRELRPGRYIIGSTGTALLHATVEDAGWGLKDAGAKLRAIPISVSSVAYVSTDSDTGQGITICVLQYSGTSPGGVELAYEVLADKGIVGMPDGPAVSVTSSWDAIYNSVSNTLLVYFRDSANARVLRRTTYNLTTMLTSNDSIIVTTLASGTASIQAIRVQRNAPAGTIGLVQLAVLDAGVYTLQNVIDTFNLAPNAPILTPRNNFDATTAALFAWTFSDPNVGDTQSAYELEIYDVADNSLDLDTGKMASATSSRSVTGGTLVNSKNYRWRVRTWDAADVVSAWSTYGTFSTSAGGTVTITDPATDNPVGVITDDYGVDWSVTGTTQAGYRVKLIRTDTSVTLSDTGWMAGTATTYTITGMVTDVQHRIEVTVRNASLVESGTGTRLITPSFGTPETPTITVTADDVGGFVLVAVTNPTPTGDRPEVVRNDILQRASGETLWSVIGSCGANDEFRDYTAASSVLYEYVARGTA